MTRPRRTPPLSARELRQRTLPRRGLGLQEAALYVGVNPKLFSRLVRMGRAPQPRVIDVPPGSTVERWDIQQLDDFIDRLPSRGSETPSALPKSRLFNL